jgi:EAL domain-containing protein (putative c-di-GMP-specific phosphodiesterase class I)
MLRNNILDFLYELDSNHVVSEETCLKPGNSVIAIHIKNYIIMKSLLDSIASQELVDSAEYFIDAFLTKNLPTGTKFNIQQLRPYSFIVLENIADIQKIIYELDNALTMRNHQQYDVQFIITYTTIKNDTDPIELFRNMVQVLASDSKRSGIIEYKENITQILTKEYEILSNLKSSIKARLARFAYQPIIECATGSISYYECLLRVPNNDGELVSAGPSILMAEKYGIINCVDRAVIKMAALELASAKDLKLSVNISYIGLLDDRLLEDAKLLLKDYNIASRLIIEITETSVNEDLKRTSEFVNVMRGLGCKIAIDDFGAGSTSFSQLKQIRFDILKIDGSLIRDIANNPYNRFLVEMLVKVAEEVGAKTVAEFVENGAIAKFLLDSKVDFMQGNFFSPAQNFRSWSKK